MAKTKTPRPSRGVFVTFEGIDGSGKTTQAKLLYEALKEEGRSVVLLREPGGTPVAERIRSILLEEKNEPLSPRAEILLFLASRAQLVEQAIIPALRAKKIVILERFIDSTTAYQAYGRGFSPPWVEKLNRWSACEILPDLTIELRVPVKVGLDRKKGDLPDRIEKEGKAFEEKVFKGYLKIAKRHNRIRIMDGTPPPAEVAKGVKKLVDDYLKKVEK